MFPTKSILETLAALGTGAILLGGCAGSQTPVNSTEVPAAEVKTEAPAETKEAAPTETASGGATAGATSGAADTNSLGAIGGKSGAEPTKAGAEPAAAAPAGSGAPAAAPTTTAKPKPKKTAGTKKPGAAGACGEGTCG